MGNLRRVSLRTAGGLEPESKSASLQTTTPLRRTKSQSMAVPSVLSRTSSIRLGGEQKLRNHMQSAFHHIWREARLRAIWMCICLFVTCVYFYKFSEELLFVLARPLLLVQTNTTTGFISTQLTETLQTYITSGILLCWCVCTPYLIYQLWCFVIPSCNDTQRAQLKHLCLISATFGLVGVSVTLWWIMPTIWHFLYRWSSHTGTAVFIIQLQPKIYDFVMLTVRLLFISYVCSQIPVLLICCIEYNVIGLKECIKQRRGLLCCSVCLAALVTPPDIGSQIAAWLPMYLVIEFSLFYALIRRNYGSAPQSLTRQTRPNDA